MTDDKATLFAALAAPFPADQVRTLRKGGKDIRYITARTVMNRLDDVLGPDGWWDHYQPLENSVICELTIRLADGSTITKSDAGGCAGMADAGDDDKSGFSDAFKRAAVKFGIGRYLYGDGVPGFASGESGVASGENKPRRKSRAIDSAEELDKPLRKIQPVAPKTGRELDEWIKQCKIDPGLILWIRDTFCAPRRWPQWIVKWSDTQVAEALPLIGQHLRDVKAQQQCG